MSKKKHLQRRLDHLFNDLQIKEETPIPGNPLPAGNPSWNWQADPDGLYTLVSSQAADCLGINHHNFVGKSIFHYAITPQSGKRLRILFDQQIFPAEIDVYFQTAEGVFIPTHFQVLKSPNQNGNKGGYHGFVQVLSENFVEPFVSDKPSHGKATDVSFSDLFTQANLEIEETSQIDFHHTTIPTTPAGILCLEKNQLVAQAGSAEAPAVIAIPVNMQEEGYGVLELIDYDPSRKWTEDDTILVEEVAKQLSLAIENAQLYTAAQKELSERVKAQQEILDLNKDLASLNEFGQQLSRYTAVDDILKLTKEMLDSIVDYHKLIITFIDQKTNQVRFPLVFEKGEFLQLEDFESTQKIPDEVFKKQQTLSFTAADEQLLQQYSMFFGDRTPQSFLTIPMPIGESIKGAILLINYEENNAFSSSDIDLMATIALQTASSLENANLFQEIRTALSSIESREKYQSNVAQAVATLTKFGSNSLREVLEMLRQDHGISWSVEVLRQVTSAVSDGVSEHLQEAQRQILLKYLAHAHASKGRRKITLSIGRDGIMLPIRGETKYKEAAVATVTVYDRRGQRVGTVYLGQMPQAHQTALSDDLTQLLTRVLQAWEGPMPRLVYVTDAGHHPTEYFHNVLTRMENPRQPGQKLEWTRVVDFYHACEYIAKLSQVLFDDDERAALGWQHRMRHKLKHDPNAVFSILHSAAKYRSERYLTAKQDKEYQRAYQYLNSHKEFMQYCQYRKQGLPIGSGVTEAACKTVFTQRFKQSGMKWGLEGGAAILCLRLANLSQTWDAAYRASLLHRQPSIIITKLPNPELTHKIAA